MTPTAPPLRSTLLVLAALAFGVLSFTAVAVVLRVTGAFAPRLAETGVLSLVVVALPLVQAPIYMVVRKASLGRLSRAREEALEEVKQGRVPLPLHSLAIIGAALFESFGLLGVITLMLGGPWALLAAPALSVGLILMQIPTRARLERLVRGV